MLTSCALSAGEMPQIKEPDWEAWKNADPAAKKRAADDLAVVLASRPQASATQAEKEQVAKKLNEAYASLQKNADASYAVAAELLRKTTDDWERLTLGLLLAPAANGSTYLHWAMAKSTSLPPSLFEQFYYIARGLARERKPEVLPAITLMMKASEGRLRLPFLSWHIPFEDCLFYVFGTYGKDAVPYLRTLLNDPYPVVRRNAAILLGYFFDRESVAILRFALKSDDLIAGGAAFALGEMGIQDAAKDMVPLLKHPDARTRFFAAYGIYELKYKEALPDLVEASHDESDTETFQEITETINYLTENPKPEPVVKKLSREELDAALDAAERSRGMTFDADVLVVSCEERDMPRIEKLLLLPTEMPSDKAHKKFRQLRELYKKLHRRLSGKP
ncbi:MAG TPA: HEAT repeat domain-containing protein [Planctomycetota bacterium]|nr:HEAT repeat domain-containing protein [Planctomycetota bacterium]